ncbi:MAG: DUF1553 domain-containing protein, partial [Planctomycetaceae bacterium]|nr:DUF1553 domain-containing protein [Planctomycetaceae bacterium]
DRQKLDELSEQIALAEKQRKPLDKKVKTLEGEDLEAAKQQLAKITAHIQKLKTDKKQTESLGQWTMVTQGLPTPRVSRILPRGNWLDETGPVVLPAVPEFMESINVERRATRLDLANWLTNSEQVSGKLTARVLANRIWFLLMGSGVSSSLDDFGGQGKPPSNPELLDNLAWELIENGW